MEQYLMQIKRSSLFEGIREDELLLMLECMGARIRVYHKGEIIILAEDKARFAGVVLRGSVHMVRENPDGDRALIMLIKEGEVFGETFALRSQTFSYTTFLAGENTVVLTMDLYKVRHMCSNRCEFHQIMLNNMIGILAIKNVRLMEKIDISSQKTLRDKILTYLQLEMKRTEQDYVCLDISRTILAEYLNVNRSALARELTGMKQDGIIDFDKNCFRVKETE